MGSFISGATGYRIIGQSDGLRCGWAIAGLGDINQDGFDDIAFTTWYDDTTYVIFGLAEWNYNDVTLFDWDGTWTDLGFRLVGAGESVSSAGDVNADSGLLSTKYSLSWDVMSILSSVLANSVAMGANSVRSGVAYSEVAVCSYSASLLCSVMEFSDTTFESAVDVPYTKQTVYLGRYTTLPLVSVVDPSSSSGVGVVRNFAYTPSASVVKGMVAEGNVAYLLLNIALPGTAKTIAVLKVNAVSGAITQQMLLAAHNINVTCTNITTTTRSLILICATGTGVQNFQSSVVIATNRDLSFKRIPEGWARNSTITFKTQVVAFSATSFIAPTATKVIPTSSFTYSTLGQTPTWRPTTAPTIALGTSITVAPTVANSSGNSNVLPTVDNQHKQGGLTSHTVIIGVGAAGGALGLGCIAIMLCAACSYKLRKKREKYAEKRKTELPAQDVHTVTLETRRIETLKVLNDVLKTTAKPAPQDATQRTTMSDSITPIHTTPSPEESSSQSIDFDSVSSSSLEMSSLHSSEMSETEYYFTGLIESKTTKSARRLSEMEAQRVLSTDETITESKGIEIDTDDDSSVFERGFNEIMAEFSDDSSWDDSLL
eukprot:gene7522-9019_t